jgi:hypothetical protein
MDSLDKRQSMDMRFGLLDWSGSGEEQVVSFCEFGNEPSG